MSAPQDHPLRARLSDLMHARALPIFSSPVIVRSWVYLIDDDERPAERQWIDSLPGEHGAEGWTLHDIGAHDGMIWERHGEFSTYLHFTTQVNTAAERRGGLGFGHLHDDVFPWLAEAPGKVFRSVEIAVLRYAPKADQLQRKIDLTQAVCCDVFDGAARIWSDFRLHDGSSGRIYVHDKGLRNDELSRLLQCLIEIGHYRKLALLGFPVARDLMAWLKGAEDRLAAVTADMAGKASSQEDILERLMALSAEVEQRVGAVRYRQGATEAYAQLTEDRLASLRESRVEGFSTMHEFIERRLHPAMRTCQAASRRLDDISGRIGRVSDLLRARISISLEVQNQSLLKSMDLRSKLQVKLQGLVEGLSVFAVSYYIFNLVKYALEPAIGPKWTPWLYPPVIILIVVLAWLFIYHRKKRIENQADAP
jgi:uncharacterized membrane-anchored protein